MELPNRENAFVPPAKLIDYLLSESHPVGAAKAKFFRMFGFNELNLSLLEDGLLNIARSCLVREVESASHGTKYRISGPMETPTGRIVHVMTVWFIGNDETDPRFITAFPD